jgi:hypothetical protein
MVIKSLDELREVDERTLKFQPLGLGGRMRPEDAARYQQEVISHPGIDPGVPQRVSGYFERLRTIYSYGVLCYDFFTVAYDQAQLALEFALRERFLEFHSGTVPFQDKDGGPHDVAAVTFDQLYAEISGHLRKRDGGWRLVLRTDDTVYFDGMLDSLIRWARSEGLLRGQRNRTLEPVFKKLRNHVAHGPGDHLLMPADAARAGSATWRRSSINCGARRRLAAGSIQHQSAGRFTLSAGAGAERSWPGRSLCPATIRRLGLPPSANSSGPACPTTAARMSGPGFWCAPPRATKGFCGLTRYLR